MRVLVRRLFPIAYSVQRTAVLRVGMLRQKETARPTLPAMCEFSEYGGVHKIDGKSTGVLPDDIPIFAVGMNPRH